METYAQEMHYVEMQRTVMKLCEDLYTASKCIEELCKAVKDLGNIVTRHQEIHELQDKIVGLLKERIEDLESSGAV